MSRDLKTCLRGVLPDEELSLLVRSYDVVGDMAIIIIADALVHRERLIGEAVLANNPRIRVVARRDGCYSGEFRTIPLKIIAGDDRKETMHKEHGVRLLVNPEEVYYSVRSASERHRVASLVTVGERVLVLFSGIGPYPLVIAANSEASLVVGIEKNPEAHRYAEENLLLNRKVRNVLFFQGDVRSLLPKLDMVFERVVMPLPHGAEEFLPLALTRLVPGGWLHFYTMQDQGTFTGAAARVQELCRKTGRELVSPAVVKAGHCAPGRYRISVEGVVR